MSALVSAMPPRVASGIDGLDAVLGGGLFVGGVYIVCGPPGSGKTIFGNQLAFAHVRRGGRVVYVTLLTETHARMFAQLSTLAFFDSDAVGEALFYVNGYNAVEAEADGLLPLLRRVVRDRKATLLVIDGTPPAETFAHSALAYKKFIQGLQTWVGLLGCTALLLTSSGGLEQVPAEHNMVDGIVELAASTIDQRCVRELCVTKFRGSAFLEGKHAYVISGEGIVVYPRVEVLLAAPLPRNTDERRATIGIRALDAALQGGVARGSRTLVLGGTGTGKTVLGLHFLEAGLQAGEDAVFFGFFETPQVLVANATRLGFSLSRALEEKRLAVLWQPPAERILDALAERLLRAVKELRAERVVIDGLVGFKAAAAFPNRLMSFVSVVGQELAAMGATVLLTDEISDAPLSAICDNVFLLGRGPGRGRLTRSLSIVKLPGEIVGPAELAFDIKRRGIELERRAKTGSKRGRR